MSANSIAEVVSRLSGIREQEADQNSALCLFPSLYQKVTEAVRDKIIEGNYFDDNARMEKLDVIFANRYLDAYQKWKAGESTSLCWQRAFEAPQSGSRVLILQHLLLGMNAHINYDLGISAAQSVAPGEVESLKADFNRINDLLFSMVNSVQDQVSQYSPWLGLLDQLGGRTEERLFEFSMKKARDFAWRFAKDLDADSPDSRETHMQRRMEFTSSLANKIISPGWLLSMGIRVIGWKESTDYRNMF